MGMDVDYAMWTYPWDVLDEGAEAVIERLDALGVGEINLATNYHTVQAFLPHNPERRTFFAHASAYFEPRGDYGDIEPVPNEQMGDEDWLEQIATALEAADADVGLNSWTVGCHNSRLGMAHRDAALTNAHGDDLVFGLCPSNPAVREYLVALVSDLDGRGHFDRIELESFDYFFGSGFGWHHDKFHTRLGTLGEFLYGICFCDHCRENAADKGIDVDRARSAVATTVDSIADGAFPHDTAVAGWLAAHPTVEAYVRARIDTLYEVYEAVTDAVSDAALGCYVGFLGIEDAWMHGYDLDRFGDLLDYYTVIAYESSRADAVDRLRVADAFTDVPLHAGVLPGHPAVHDEATVASIVDGLERAGAERISFYNYGLLPTRNLEWIGAAIDR